jgi:allophanate hydrolase
MSAILAILRAGPLVTIQDEGRFGMLRHGISASGPMDLDSFQQAGVGGRGAIEITTAGLDFRVTSGQCCMGFAGGAFTIAIDGEVVEWPGQCSLVSGSMVSVTPGPSGNYGYLRFDTDILVAPAMGSIATSSRAHLGGLNGKALQVGDVIELGEKGSVPVVSPPARQDMEGPFRQGPFRFVWGVHADLFAQQQRQRFLSAGFKVSTRLDRMGVRLEDTDQVFSQGTNLSLVSEAIVPGDIQILGDGTPIVLMRDHQPTGGYPRIATIIAADLDRFAQVRPGTAIAFQPVTVEHAQELLRSRG